MIAFDSNILIYIGGIARANEDFAKMDAIREMLPRLANKAELVAPAQALGEVYNVCQRKGPGRAKARELVSMLQESFTVIGSDQATLIEAVDLATEHRLQYWDALILNIAADAGCSLLLSEDMQDGFTWRGVTVVNPFAEKMHKRLVRVLG